MERALPRVCELTSEPILVRWDSGFHNIALGHQIDKASKGREISGKNPIHYLVKSNPHRMIISELHAECVNNQRIACISREGKRYWIWETPKNHQHKGEELPYRRINRLIERTIDVSGQALLVPKIEFDFWDTTLPAKIQAN